LEKIRAERTVNSKDNNLIIPESKAVLQGFVLPVDYSIKLRISLII
jgi:hypothetical protein